MFISLTVHRRPPGLESARNPFFAFLGTSGNEVDAVSLVQDVKFQNSGRTGNRSERQSGDTYFAALARWRASVPRDGKKRLRLEYA
jgi:hypothetical protein